MFVHSPHLYINQSLMVELLQLVTDHMVLFVVSDPALRYRDGRVPVTISADIVCGERTRISALGNELFVLVDERYRRSCRRGRGAMMVDAGSIQIVVYDGDNNDQPINDQPHHPQLMTTWAVTAPEVCGRALRRHTPPVWPVWENRPVDNAQHAEQTSNANDISPDVDWLPSQLPRPLKCNKTRAMIVEQDAVRVSEVVKDMQVNDSYTSAPVFCNSLQTKSEIS